MSLFPLYIPGIDIVIKRSTIYSTTIESSDYKIERRASWYLNPRYKYEIKFNFLRQSVLQSTYDEVAELVNFFDSNRGSLYSFSLIDPVDGITRQVRFDESLTLEQFLYKIYNSSVILIGTFDSGGA
jgi:hypothetical protein